jgi:NAD(P)-dependent dehydrogenase (short-subunit alcohol dehydrogenase family)
VDLGLDGRVVLVTGGSRGIGRETTRLLVAEGAQVAICGRDLGACEAAAQELGDGVAGFAADVTDDESVERMVEAVIGRFGRLDGLVNNAGQFGGGPVMDLTAEGLLSGANAKSAGTLRVLRHARPWLARSDQARVVNVSGVSAHKVTPGAVVTAIANSGLLTLTAYLAHELLAEGIVVNAIVPGYTLTGVWAQRAAAVAEAEGISQDDALRLILERQGMGHARWGDPEEIAQVIAFLLSRQAGFVNGMSLRVDGGQLPVVTY